MKQYAAPSVKKAFVLLKAIASSKEGLGVSEMSRDLAMAKSTVHGMACALEEIGALIRDPQTKKYRLGFTLFELGRLAYSQTDLKTIARPVLEELMVKTQGTVFLGVLNVDHVTVLDIVESLQDLKITAPVGASIPLFAGAVGKVMLSSMSGEQALKIINEKGIPRFTEKTNVDPDEYYRQLRETREKGYAVDDEEYIMGAWAVASSIKQLGQIIPAIWVVDFKASLDEKRMETIIKETRKAADTISRRVQDQITIK